MKREKLLCAMTYGGAVLIASALLFLLGKYAVVCLLPFTVAYLVTLAVRPAAAAVSKKFGVGKRFVSVFFVIILITAIFFLLSWIVTVIARGVSLAASSLSAGGEMVTGAIEKCADLLKKIPFLSEDEGAIYDTLSSLVKDAAGALASFAASTATALISALPRVVLALVATVISTFYLCTDKGKLRREATEFLGKAASDKLFRFRSRINDALSSYFKGYFTMMLLTFAELFLGFIILGVDGAFTAAVLIAVVDMLPILGSGIVMVPWALVELFVTKDTATGAGLLVMVAVMYIVRQFAEPRVIGQTMGIHPLVTLTSVYVGFVLFGFTGVIFFPILLHLIKAIRIPDK